MIIGKKEKYPTNVFYAQKFQIQVFFIVPTFNTAEKNTMERNYFKQFFAF